MKSQAQTPDYDASPIAVCSWIRRNGITKNTKDTKRFCAFCAFCGFFRFIQTKIALSTKGAPVK